jgi:hypothetical protein
MFCKPADKRVAIYQRTPIRLRQRSGAPREVLIGDDHRAIALVEALACDRVADGASPYG